MRGQPSRGVSGSGCMWGRLGRAAAALIVTGWLGGLTVQAGDWVITDDTAFAAGALTNLTITDTGDEATLSLAEGLLTGEFISAVHDTAMLPDYGTLTWTGTVPAGAELKFQVRTAASTAGLAAATWQGPTGAASWYTTSGTSLPATHDGQSWVQLRASFSAPDAEHVPVLADATLAAEPADVVISASTDWATEGVYNVHNLTIRNGATLSLAGGSVLQVDGTLRIEGSSTLLLKGKNILGQVSGAWAGAGGVICAGEAIIEAGSQISANGQGYAKGQGPGGSGDAYGGGSYGGTGTGGSGPVYGSPTEPTDLGSAAAAESTSQTWGGGAIRLSVTGTLQLNGEISASGTHSRAWWSHAIGGGAGGSVWVTVGTLTGAGRFTAYGNNKGGGGRIAVYYRDGTGFTGFTASGADGADGAQTGTCAFFHTGVPNQHAFVYQRFTWAQDSDVHYGALTLADTAVGEVGGGTVFTIDGDVLVTGNSTLQFRGKNTSGQVGGAWAGAGVTLNAANLTVDAGSVITADGQGYAKTQGPGGCGDMYGGGSYGGLGTGGAGPTYGSAMEPTALGSAAAAESTSQTWGGGAMRLNITGTLQLGGEVTADGTYSRAWWAHAIGGGSGGSIWVTTSTLAGAGRFTADGNNKGGGGRIAVYYHDGTGFTGFLTSSVAGADSAQDGTLLFLDASVPNYGVLIAQRFACAANSALHFGALTVTDGAKVELGGGSELVVDGDLTIGGTSTVYAYGTNVSAQVAGSWTGAGVRISAKNLLLETGSAITADGCGYTKTAGPGGTGDVYNQGGSHGGLGKNNSGVIYDSEAFPLDLGSGGGAEGSSDSTGGGAIRIHVDQTFTLNGDVTADGVTIQRWWTNAISGSAGGSVFISTGTLTGTGSISADASAGGGGGGRVAIHYWNQQLLPVGRITVAGRDGGHNGTIYTTSTPSFRLTAPADRLFHGTEQLTWEGLALDPAIHWVGAAAYGSYHELGLSLPVVGGTRWDTTTVPDGIYELRASFWKADAGVIGEVVRRVLVNNAVAWHSGRITANETWAAGTVHVVDANLSVGAGVQVTVEPGAVIKFAPGRRLTVETGAVLTALGSLGSRIVFTSLTDDSVGGDTNLDGVLSTPQPGDWPAPVVQGTGQFVTNEFTDLHYLSATHTGTVAADEVWVGSFLHRITGDITVPSGVTLTIQPGAVLKFDAGKSLIVNAGGTLSALGSMALPIVFTSIKDDTVGGDTNGNGDATAPAPGDWYRLFINGGRADFDHADIRYGAGADSVQSALVRTAGDAQVTIRNSRLSAALYTGVLVWGGTTTITNSVVTDADRGISAHPGGTVNVLNCTVDGNRVGLMLHDGTPNVTNSTITGSSGAASAGIMRDYGTDRLTIRYSNVWNPAAANGNYSGAASRTGQDGNLSVDAKYRNAATGDYHLQYRSPMIDAADGGAAPATDSMGAPRYDDPRTGNSGIPAAGGAYADIGAYEFVETAASDVDLVVVSVVAPLEAMAGDQATLQWTIANRGTGVAVGPWHDAVYLEAAGQLLAAGEVLVAAGETLGPGETLSVARQVRVPAALAGAHRWQVQTNNRGDVFEGTHAGNNRSFSALATDVVVAGIIIDGEPASGYFTEARMPVWYRVVVPAGQDLLIDLTPNGAGGIIELYASRDAVPTRDSYLVRSLGQDGGGARLFVPAAAAPSYCYVMAYPVTLPTGTTTFELRVTHLGVEVHAVSPDEVGDCGQVALDVMGGGFRAEFTYELVDAGGTAYAPLATEVLDSTHALVLFSTQGLPHGAYDVRVGTGRAGSTLPGAVTVTDCRPANVRVDIVGRDKIRGGGRQAYQILYGNTGNVDSAECYLYASTSAPLTFTSVLEDDPLLETFTAYDGALVTYWLPRVRAGTQGSIHVTAEAVGAGTNAEVRAGVMLGAMQPDFQVPEIPAADVHVGNEILAATDDSVRGLLHVTAPADSGDIEWQITRTPAAAEQEPVVTYVENGDQVECTITCTVAANVADGLFGSLNTTGGGGRGAPGATNRQREGLIDTIVTFFRGSKKVTTAAGKAKELKQTINEGQLQEILEACLVENGYLNAGAVPELESLRAGKKFVQLFDIALLVVPGDATYWAFVVKVMNPSWGMHLRHALQDNPKGAAAAQELLGIDGNLVAGIVRTWPGMPECICRKLKEKTTGGQRGSCIPCQQAAERSGTTTATDQCYLCMACAVLHVGVVSSQDPNEKSGPVGAGATHAVGGSEGLAYAISFENVATATAPAAIVTVTDTLDITTLDPTTFVLGPMTFGSTLVDPPAGLTEYTTVVDLRPGRNLLVLIEAGLNLATGVARWRFTSLDPDTLAPPEDPLLGFLPPDNANHDGEGYVSFLIQSQPGLATGTELRNKAEIVFDANASIWTNETLNAIDRTSPTATFTYAAPTATNQDVTATLVPDEPVTVLNNDGLPAYIFTANGTFTFQFVDGVGNTGEATATVSWIDRTPPTATVAYSTTAPTNGDVVATLNPSETVTVTNNGGALTRTFSANGSFTFEFSDPAGNTGTATATVTNIDQLAPSVVPSISSGATYTTTPAVLVLLAAADTGGSGVADMRLSNDGTTWSPWEAWASAKAWTLTAGDGVKTVYAQVRDAVGNVSAVATDAIRLDTVPKPDVVITDIRLEPAVPVQGSTFTAYVTVRNVGNKAGNGGSLYAWADRPLEPPAGTRADKTASVGTLKPGEAKILKLSSFQVGAAAGVRTLRAWVDAKNQTPELDDADNQRTLLWHTGRPDFVVTGAVFTPDPPPAGGAFTAAVTVKNVGESPGDAGSVDIWLNQATAVVAGPKAKGERSATAGVLQPGQEKVLRFTQLKGGTVAGQLQFRAMVDTKTKTVESDDTNNQAVWPYHVGRPDFSITKIEFAPDPVTCGRTFTAYVTVKNSGESAGDAGYVDAWANQAAAQVAGTKTKGDKAVTAGVLQPGQETRLRFTSLPSGAGGNRVFRAMVDSRAKTAESDDLNNQATESYACAPAGP